MKIISTLTNEILLEFNYDNIFSDYIFCAVFIPHNTKDKNYYKTIYSSIKKEFNPKARTIRRISKGHEYIIAIDKDFSFRETQFSVRKMGLSEMKSIPKSKLFSILLSLMVGRGSFFELSSNPYDVYYTYSVSNSKIIALRIDLKEVNKKIHISLAATNFKKIAKATRECYIEENGVLLPYKDEVHKGYALYQKGNFKSSKSTVPFLGLDGNSFTQAKTYYFDLITKDIEEYLITYVKLSFKSIEISVYSDAKDKKKKKEELSYVINKYVKKIGKIHIANLSNDIQYGKLFLEAFSEAYGNMLEISASLLTVVDIPQITITKPKSYYEENKEEKDPYHQIKKIKVPTQNITIDTGVSKTILNVLMKELALNCEMHGYGAFIQHTHYVDGCRYFHIENKDADIFYKASLTDDRIVTSEPTDEEQEILESIMFDLPLGEDAEFAVMMDDDIMLVTKTNIFPLPNFTELSSIYSRDTKNVFLDKNKILGIAERMDKYPCTINTLSRALDEIMSNRGIPSTKLMNLSSKFISRGLKKLIEKSAGRPFRFLVRNEKAKSLYAGMLGISHTKCGDGSVLYHVGIASGQLRSSIDKNNPYRRITAIKGEINLDYILPLMEEYFVKYNELTILPYSLKYAREGYKIYEKEEEIYYDESVDN